jgi:hypothetical protein
MMPLMSLTNIRALSLRKIRDIDQDLPLILGRMTFLTCLRLSNIAIPPGTLKQLATLSALRDLSLFASFGINDVELGFLSQMTQLEDLNLRNVPNITLRSVRLLKTLPLVHFYASERLLQIPEELEISNLANFVAYYLVVGQTMS